MKYKVGDKVRIRADLEIGCDYGRDVFAEGMESFKGKVATITKINARNEYIIDVDNGFWSWTDEMLEPVPKYKVGDKVTIRKNLKVYGCESVVSAMMAHRGQQATIKDVIPNSYKTLYKTNCTNYHWTEDMFEDSITGTVETTADCDFKVGDKIIMNPERSSAVGVFTIKRIEPILNNTFYHVIHNDGESAGGWLKESIFKVPLFKKGDIVTFKNIEKDKWFSPGPMSKLEGCSGVIDEVKENYYMVDKQGQDGCKYTVRDTKTDNFWFVTSASIERVSAMESIGTIDYYSKEDIIAATTTAEVMAQAVDNVKGSQFKVGDTIVIRDDLVPGKEYTGWGGWIFTTEMARYAGKVAKITKCACIDNDNDRGYYRLDIDEGRWSWITDALLHYTPGSDYDLDRTTIIYKQTKQNYENRLQEKGTVIEGRERQSGCAVRYPGEQIRVGISNLGYRKVTCKR